MLNGVAGMRATLFQKDRIVGVRLSGKEYERLHAAMEEGEKGKTPWQVYGNRWTISSFVRMQLGPIINPPAVKSQVIVKQQRSKKNAKRRK